MPIYEYICQDCNHRFDRLWPTVASAQDQQPVCPACASSATQRTVSQVAVLGKLGELTPTEQSAASEESAKTASYTPKEQIQAFQANRQRKREQGK
jgi:putative FmdB family regulatory protein